MNRNRGFTIVELLVVIVVIGILAAITIVSYTGISKKATIVSIQSDLSNSSGQLTMYNMAYHSYPTLDTNNCPSSPNVDSRYCIKLSGDNTIDSYEHTTNTFDLVIRNGSVTYHITDNGGPPTEIVNWINGRSGTALDGEQVYMKDVAASQWKTNPAEGCNDPQCAADLDPYFSGLHVTSLVSNNNVDFSSYPARDACREVGGRLPYVDELIEIYLGRVSTYGNNFTANSFYWSATGDPTDWALSAVQFNDSSYLVSTVLPAAATYNVRCVKGSPNLNNTWMDGATSGVLNGKHIYHSDISDRIWGPTSVCPTASDGTKQCSLNLDPSYPTAPTLVSPQTYPSVDFSLYPAQNACKSIGGRLPNTVELSAIQVGYASGVYGNNFADGNYWSATDSPGISLYLNIKTNTAGSTFKSTSYHIRCIKD